MVEFVDLGTKEGGFASRGEFIAALVAAANAKQVEIEQALIEVIRVLRGGQNMDLEISNK